MAIISQKSKKTSDAGNYILRDLSWLEFNDRVLQEGLNPQLPLGERLRFLAIVSSNLDEFFKVRVASAMQLCVEQTRKLANTDTSAAQLLKAISARTHTLVDAQTQGILTAMQELPRYGVNLHRFAQVEAEKDRAYLRTYFEHNILPLLTPMAVEDLAPSPLLPSLQLHVALWLRVPVEMERGFKKKTPFQDPPQLQAHPGVTVDLEAIPFTSENDSQEMPEMNPPSAKTVKAEKPVKAAKRGRPKKSELQEAATAEENAAADVPDFVEKLAVIPVPTRIPRLVKLEESEEKVELIFLEGLIAANADMLFPGCEVLSSSVFRITRDEDVIIRGQDAEDMTKAVREAVLSRKRRSPIRLEISAGTDVHIREKLMRMMDLTEDYVYELEAPLDATVFFGVTQHPLLKKACYENWPAFEPYDLLGAEDIMEVMDQRDVMLFHPYEKFDSVIELLDKAASDPDVLAIKQTLYRTSGGSAIVKALKKAAENGKEVVVLVELKARFDEAQNVEWALQLENAGCHVIYGVAGLKTHAKAMLIVRRQRGRIERYVHLSTGNYNEKTATLYSDIGLMTTNREITADVAAFFNMLTGYSEAVGWNRLTVEPFSLKRRFLDLIEREASLSTPELPGRIRIKMNSLEDRDMIDALYAASRKGVRIDLNIRGICCLRPGVPELSETITVRSIIDRYLEHARIFEFQNGGHPEIFLSSADWMMRNLERRLEIIFPIISPPIKRRISHLMDVYFEDNVKARVLHSDGTWHPVFVEPGEERIRAQEALYLESEEASTTPSHPPTRYVPLRRKSE